MAQLEVGLGNDAGALFEEHRRALIVHCYRFLGSIQDAEEAVQETFLKAWRSRAGFRGDASIRTWLYRIATRVCLDLIEKRKRRLTPVLSGPAARPDAPPLPPPTEVAWLEPIPTGYLADETRDPASAYSAAESVKLAFVAALQTLPPRQRAVLILRDVLAWSAAETAEALEMSVGAANSALHRARQRLAQTHHASGIDAMSSPDPDDRATIRLLDAYVRAWRDDDVDALIATLREDVRMAMPPSPSWYSGRADVVAFMRAFVWSRGTYRLVPISMNAQPAYRLSMSTPAGEERDVGVHVITLLGDRIAALDFFLTPDAAGG